jgi:protoheme IX farnesyltransferase
MITEKVLNVPFGLALRNKLYDYGLLVKFKLNITVVFSTVMGFIIGSSGTFHWFDLFIVTIGGFLTVGAANGINQIIERDSDKLMKRTSNRPVATHRISVFEAAIVCTLMGVVGVMLIGVHLNQLSGLLSFASLCIYAFLYTPLKRISPIAVYVGAIPGALPPIIGYVAANGTLGLLGITLFFIQFVWQFPHFYSIAWLLDEDYKRAGIKLMPLGTVKDRKAAFQILIFCILLIPFSMLPYILGCAHLVTCLLLALSSAVFCIPGYKLWVSLSNADAKKLMFASILYLPVSFIILLIEKLY